MQAAERTDGYQAAAGYYDLFASGHGDSALPSVAFFTALTPPGARVLDVGAGTGRITLPIAERAASVHALEPSATMRAVLLARISERPPLRSRVTVLPLAAPDFRLGRRFDYALVAGVLQFLTAAGRRELFEVLAAHLLPGGLLAIDMISDGPVPDWPDRLVEESVVGECRYRLRCGAKADGPEHARLRLTYTTQHSDGLVSTETVERDRYLHGRAATFADLAATGFSVVGGSAERAASAEPPDGGTLIARLEGTGEASC